MDTNENSASISHYYLIYPNFSKLFIHTKYSSTLQISTYGSSTLKTFSNKLSGIQMVTYLISYLNPSHDNNEHNISSRQLNYLYTHKKICIYLHFQSCAGTEYFGMFLIQIKVNEYVNLRSLSLENQQSARAPSLVLFQDMLLEKAKKLASVPVVIVRGFIISYTEI